MRGPCIFRPGITLTVIVLPLVVLFVRLGFWQIQRAGQKQAAQAAQEHNAALPPLRLREEALAMPQMRLRRIVATGVYEADKEILLDSQTYEGRVGVHVLTPLRLDGSQTRVLVDRGWVEWGTDRRQLPVVETPPGEVEVHGFVDLPAVPAIALGGLPPLPGQPARLWPYLDLGSFEKYAGYRVQPYLIREDPGDAHGFVRAWSRNETGPATHYGYALQWFAFAAIAVAVYIGLSVSRAGKAPISYSR